MTTHCSSLEQKLAWRWLRQQLTAELGVHFIGGVRRRLSAVDEAAVRADIATREWGERREAYREWADRLGVSESTIQRTVQRWAGRVPEGVRGLTRYDQQRKVSAVSITSTAL